MHLHGIGDGAAVRDDRVFTDDTRTDIYRVVFRREDGTVAQTGCAIDFTVFLDDRIGNLLGVYNLHTVTDGATFWLSETDFLVDQTCQAIFQLLILKVFHHKGCQLRVQIVEKQHIAVTHLVEYTDQVTFAKGSTIGGFHCRDVRDIAVTADGIVVDEVTDLLDKTVIANGDITQRGIVDTRMFRKAFGYFNSLFKNAQTDVAIKHDTVEVVGAEVLSDSNPVPVFSPTAVIFEDLYLLTR